MKHRISITALATVSPLGSDTHSIREAYTSKATAIQKKRFGAHEYWVAPLMETDQARLAAIRLSEVKYKNLDPSVIMALDVSRRAVAQAGWQAGDAIGINIGSSRGATQLFEQFHYEFITTGKTATLSSPTTTLGNLSSWVAHDLKSAGPEISHSITCSTALHAILNAVAWLEAGMADRFIAGGSEAPLTAFTLAQMQALKIYSRETEGYPCKAMDLDKLRNTMVLGEGAGVVALERNAENALAYITGLGWATDELEHNISISDEAVCFQKSMTMAMGDLPLSEIDAIVMHAPGTIKGDLSEYKAIQKVFGDNLPLLTTNKWKMGHTFGASGIFSLELALLMLQEQTFLGTPFDSHFTLNKPMRHVLINAVGFGGNAVTIRISK
ncbi:3-oxoacyl-(acyl-carrier-protein) synthase [Flavobacterium fontis]|uniref:3-oxoacyl-(Acyl-carrier-protein) synthase n=1 Tax=Flavobacterium fontis TaxID=1124188 RepID=A0A1M4WG50_9FLAO|nr:beta-ketoacyl synthase N-terminal-like domain-containing protein [Flavobacterium fontis]SHE80271.1 3-oxoacyl-(acyl-carrier-protein) synthase [Flavobacterium fontis]